MHRRAQPPGSVEGAGGRFGRGYQRRFRTQLDTRRGDEAADPLGDRERGRQPGRADCRHVDQLRTGGRGPDQVVGAAAGRSQPRVGGDRLGRLELGEHPDRLREDLLPRLRSHRPVLGILLVDRGGPGDHLVVEGREDEDSLRLLAGDGEKDPVESLTGRLEDKELALAGVDLEGAVAEQRRNRAGPEAGAVDHHPTAHGLAAAGGKDQSLPAAIDACDRKAGLQCGTVAAGGGGQRGREGDRIGDRFAGDLERAVAVEPYVDPVALGVGRQLRDRLSLRVVVGSHQRPAGENRDAQLGQKLLPQGCGTEDQLRLQLSRRRVEAGVQDAGVCAARGQARLGLGLQQHHLGAAPRQRQSGRAPDHARADDGDLHPANCGAIS